MSKLGEGGMGEVYAAEHVHIEKRFAVKLLRQEIVSNKEAVSRFRQEARSASSIGHRNIIAIEDFGQLPDGRIYMCMELLNGAPLNDLIKQPLSHERLINILIQTGHGLAAAHAKGIIHRDMKPENVFVTWTAGGEDIPKLLDFGIAKVAGNEGQNNLTRTGTIFGTPYYMAPEQALGTQVDHRTDIYAMGVIMYEVFAGSLPFQGESFMGILTQHITTDPEPVAQRAAKAGRTLPPGIAEIISRCMQKDPNARFSSMDELVAALVSVYRAVAGAGMSSYMEAFPQSPQSSSHLNPIHTPNKMTPPPLTGPVMMGQGGHAGAMGGHAGAMGPPPTTGPGPGQSAPFLPSGGLLGLGALVLALPVLPRGERRGRAGHARRAGAPLRARRRRGLPQERRPLDADGVEVNRVGAVKLWVDRGRGRLGARRALRPDRVGRQRRNFVRVCRRRGRRGLARRLLGGLLGRRLFCRRLRRGCHLGRRATLQPRI
ncbi:MAG TPA: serine/threonine-protein kinase [Kofleriaceae bacterium]|nr:serine/threonine-protein kinase [Kofleriaceae bacterium]